jgi:uncharacterized membrane protein YhaH (DUF805 family)
MIALQGGSYQTGSTGLGAFFVVVALVYLAIAVVSIVAWVKILSKAGYSGWWILVGVVPVLNVVMFLVFAFSDWPVLRAARGAGQYAMAPYPPQYPPAQHPPG